MAHFWERTEPHERFADKNIDTHDPVVVPVMILTVYPGQCSVIPRVGYGYSIGVNVRFLFHSSVGLGVFRSNEEYLNDMGVIMGEGQIDGVDF